MRTSTHPECRDVPSGGLWARVLPLACAAVFLLSAGTSRAQAPDPVRGRMLYENHCRFCHTAKVHERPSKSVLTRAQLRSIVNEWQRQEGLSWSAQDTEDVVDYLALTRYKAIED